MSQNGIYDERDIALEGFKEGNIVSITFEDGEHWAEAFVVDNGYGKLVIRNRENEFMIAYPEKEDQITLLEE